MTDVAHQIDQDEPRRHLAPVEQRQSLPADPMVSMIERIAMDPNADLAKLEKMMEMKERHEASQAKARFASDFAKASAEFPTIPLNGKDTHKNTRYAKLEDILSGVRPVLSQHGFALSFSTQVTPDLVTVTAELSHEGGHSKTNSIPLPRDTGAGRNAVQAVGSSQTYGQRYTAQAILGLSLGDDTDDDGRSAGSGETITEGQYHKLRDLIGKAGIAEDVVCKAEKIEHLAELPASKFDRVSSRLETTIKNKAGK